MRQELAGAPQWTRPGCTTLEQEEIRSCRPVGAPPGLDLFVCVKDVVATSDGKKGLMVQQPYGAIAQLPDSGAAFSGSGSHEIFNVSSWLTSPGHFYFGHALLLSPRGRRHERHGRGGAGCGRSELALASSYRRTIRTRPCASGAQSPAPAAPASKGGTVPMTGVGTKQLSRPEMALSGTLKSIEGSRSGA